MTKFLWEWFKISCMMVLLFSSLWFLYSQKIKMILSVCAALIKIDDNSCYFIVNIFQRAGSRKLLLYCWYAALFCCAECRGGARGVPGGATAPQKFCLPPPKFSAWRHATALKLFNPHNTHVCHSARGGARHFDLGGPLEGPVFQQGELSMVCVL